MYCLPLDDICQLDRLEYRIVRQVVEDYADDRSTFSLGAFNGHVFTYSRINKKPVIFIDEVGKPLSRDPVMIRGD